MTIKEGDRLPDSVFVVMGESGPETRSVSDVFDGQKVALFGMPGAYTPVCHKEHLPGIVALHDILKQKGIDTVACTAVNDIFVMDRWAQELGGKDKVAMLADGNGDFAVNTGLAVDMSKYGLGIRSNRYAMIAIDRVVQLVSIEDMVMHHEKSSARIVTDQLDQAAQ